MHTLINQPKPQNQWNINQHDYGLWPGGQRASRRSWYDLLRWTRWGNLLSCSEALGPLRKEKYEAQLRASHQNQTVYRISSPTPRPPAMTTRLFSQSKSLTIHRWCTWCSQVCQTELMVKFMINDDFSKKLMRIPEKRFFPLPHAKNSTLNSSRGLPLAVVLLRF